MSDQHSLEHDIKVLIIEALGLEDISADDIGNDQTLFAKGYRLKMRRHRSSRRDKS